MPIQTEKKIDYQKGEILTVIENLSTLAKKVRSYNTKNKNYYIIKNYEGVFNYISVYN